MHYITFITEGHVVCRRSRDCFYGGRRGRVRTGGREDGDVQEDGPQQLQQPGQGPKTPMMIFLSGISAGYVILWHKIILLLMIDIAKKDILTVFM